MWQGLAQPIMRGTILAHAWLYGEVAARGILRQEGHPMPDKHPTLKVVCGGCGERVAEDKVEDVYRTTEDGFMRFRRHAVPGGTLTRLCPACYLEWDVETDGLPPSP